MSDKRPVVLVVDDNRANRRLVTALLSDEDYEVDLCESGEEALERFAARPAEIVLLDIRMPGIDGFETCRRLRELPGGGDVPIVYLTALADLGSHQMAMDSGADDYLTKPINRTELMLRVRSLLRISRMSRELRDSHAFIAGQRDELVKAHRRKDDLASFLVHDLKTPLSSIIANVDSVLSAPASPEETTEVLRDVQLAADDLLRMVVNLLDIGRSEDGELSLDRRTVDLAHLLERSLAGMRPRLEERRLSVISELAPVMIQADEPLLRRVIDNLLDNCVKYAPRGSSAGLRCIVDGSAVAIRLSDEGRGIPEDQRERIFDKYVQLDAGKSAARYGRGLGLTFCRLVVEAHGGSITVEPNRPQGSVFVVRLPLDQ